MAKHLSKEVKQTILSDNQLMADYADKIGVSVFSLPKTFERNSKTLIQHDAVEFLSTRLSKSVDEILIDEDSKVTA